MRLAVSAALFAACAAAPVVARWWRLRRWGFPVRVVADPDDPSPTAMAGYLAEVARSLDERPRRLILSIEAFNSAGRKVSLDFPPGGEMAVAVDGRPPKKFSLRRRWIPEHPVPLVLWSRRRWRWPMNCLRLYVDPVDANRFRVMRRPPCSVPAWIYAACSLAAAAGAAAASPECVCSAAGTALGFVICAAHGAG